MSEAISTFQIYLMKGSTSGSTTTWEKLVDIKDYPDLGGTPEKLDTTTLSDPIKTSILGIQDLDVLEFTANYNKTDFQTLKALEGTKNLDLAVWFGASESGGVFTPTGSDGQFKFKGELQVFPIGKGVNEVVDMKISIAASTPITTSFPTSFKEVKSKE